MRCLFLDCETTGLSPSRHQVLTIGLLLVDFSNGFEVVNEEYIFVKHDSYDVSSVALKVNGIDLDLHEGVSPDEACVRILEFLRENEFDKVVGHNIGFDFGFLRKLFFEYGFKFDLDRDYSDTMFLWRGLQADGLIPRNYRARLKDIAEYFEVDYSSAHDALADCYITASVFERMLRVR